MYDLTLPLSSRPSRRSRPPCRPSWSPDPPIRSARRSSAMSPPSTGRASAPGSRAWRPCWSGLPIDGRIVAAAGYRRASEPLYLERYLDTPVEEAIRARTGAAVDRAHVVEIGHFASARHGAGRRLMTLLARHLLSVGARWAVTTATHELRLLYDRLGLQAWWLADARPGAVGEQASDWGRYYEHAPAVLAGPIARNLAILDRRASATRPRLARGSALSDRRRRAARPRRGPARGHPAIDDGNTVLDGIALVRAVRATAAALREARVRTLATLLDNSPAWIVADLAALARRRRARAAARVLHAGAGRPRARPRRRRCAARAVPRARLGDDASCLRGRAARPRTARRRRRPDAGGHGEDHLHVGHDRHAEGRLPRRGRDARDRALARRGARAGRHRAPPRLAAARGAAREHRRRVRAAVARRDRRRAAARRGRPRRLLVVRPGAPGCGGRAPSRAQRDHAAADAARVDRVARRGPRRRARRCASSRSAARPPARRSCSPRARPACRRTKATA